MCNKAQIGCSEFCSCAEIDCQIKWNQQSGEDSDNDGSEGCGTDDKCQYERAVIGNDFSEKLLFEITIFLFNLLVNLFTKVTSFQTFYQDKAHSPLVKLVQLKISYKMIYNMT